MTDSAKDKLLEKALEATAKEYAANTEGQGTNLAHGTKALAKAAGSVCIVTAELIEAALDPFRLVIHGYNKTKEKFIPLVQKRLENVSPEDLITPDESIGGPILEAVKFKTHQEEISSLFAALLASAMDRKSSRIVHPAYIQIINELSVDEAKILNYLVENSLDAYPLIDIEAKNKGSLGKINVLKHFTDLTYKADCTEPTLAPTYVDNLCRLKLCNVPYGISLSDKSKYAALKEHAILQSFISKIIASGRNPVLEETVLQITPFGDGFIAACKLKQEK